MASLGIKSIFWSFEFITEKAKENEIDNLDHDRVDLAVDVPGDKRLVIVEEKEPQEVKGKDHLVQEFQLSKNEFPANWEIHGEGDHRADLNEKFNRKYEISVN